MRRGFAALLIMGSAILSNSASASPDEAIKSIQELQRQIDSDHLARETLSRAANAGCDVNQALSAGLQGNAQNFNAALDRSETNLRAVGDQLEKLIGRREFNKPVKIPTGILALLAPGFESINTANDILRAIAELARQSADAIERIRKGDGGERDFSLVATNSARISELVLVFYNLLAV